MPFYCFASFPLSKLANAALTGYLFHLFQPFWSNVLNSRIGELQEDILTSNNRNKILYNWKKRGNLSGTCGSRSSHVLSRSLSLFPTPSSLCLFSSLVSLIMGFKYFPVYVGASGTAAGLYARSSRAGWKGRAHHSIRLHKVCTYIAGHHIYEWWMITLYTGVASHSFYITFLEDGSKMVCFYKIKSCNIVQKIYIKHLEEGGSFFF